MKGSSGRAKRTNYWSYERARKLSARIQRAWTIILRKSSTRVCASECVHAWISNCVYHVQMRMYRIQDAGLCMRDEWRASKMSPLLLVVSYYCYCRRVSQRKRKAGVRRVARRFRYYPSSSYSRFRADSNADERKDSSLWDGKISRAKNANFSHFSI